MTPASPFISALFLLVNGYMSSILCSIPPYLWFPPCNVLRYVTLFQPDRFILTNRLCKCGYVFISCLLDILLRYSFLEFG